MDGWSTIWHNSIAFGWCFDDKTIYLKENVFLRKYKFFLLKENLLLKCIVEGIFFLKNLFFTWKKMQENVLLISIVEGIVLLKVFFT
jgi:hypothetical protein